MVGMTQLELKIRSLLRRHIPRDAAPSLSYDPYDVEALRRSAARLLAEIRVAPPQEPEERCRHILGAIQSSYPTKELADEYFSALELALHDKPGLEIPGQIVIGIRARSIRVDQSLTNAGDDPK